MNKRFSYNKGEWSEFYAFIKLLAERKIYAADENVNRVEDVYFPIIKIIRKEDDDFNEYLTGETVKIFVNDNLVEEILDEDLDEKSIFLFEKIFSGDAGKKGAFEIPDIESFMNKMRIKKIKAPVKDKEDITMQVHDVYTGFSPTVGFSVKSDIGSPSTLLNAGKNTRIRYKITGLTDDDAEEINSIDKTIAREYMKVRIGKLFERSSEILFDGFSDRTFEDNLILIDSFLPEIYAQMILLHYRFLDDGLSDCETITEILEATNPLNYHRADIYKYKFKKMITAAALGMTPGKPWDGIDSATGGYIIIKKDGDVLCYHIYNRNYFEQYLLKNTEFDRPSATRHDYGYIYSDNGNKYIDLNVQIRFKSINKASVNAKEVSSRFLTKLKN